MRGLEPAGTDLRHISVALRLAGLKLILAGRQGWRRERGSRAATRAPLRVPETVHSRVERLEVHAKGIGAPTMTETVFTVGLADDHQAPHQGDGPLKAQGGDAKGHGLYELS